MIDSKQSSDISKIAAYNCQDIDTTESKTPDARMKCIFAIMISFETNYFCYFCFNFTLLFFLLNFALKINTYS